MTAPDTHSPQVAKSHRPWPQYRYFFALIFVVLAVTNAWFIRFEPQLEKNRKSYDDFDLLLDRGLLQDLKTPLSSTYTGIAGLDNVIARLVLVFAPGPFRFDDGVAWQQTHLIVNYSAIVAILVVEASREVNRGRIITFTSIWALFYQTLTGAMVIPLYYVVYTLTVPPPSTLPSTRAATSITPTLAFALLASVVLIYILPTLGMYYLPLVTPDSPNYFLGVSIGTLQTLIGFWQLCPLFVNPGVWIISRLAPSPSIGEGGKKQALSTLYTIVCLICVFAHFTTIYHCFLSFEAVKPGSGSSPLDALSRIFVPSMTGRHANVTEAIHYIFVWDFWGIFISSLVWVWMSILEVFTVRRGKGKPAGSAVGAAFLVAALAIIIGPGAVMALVWSWREEALERVDDDQIKTAKSQ